MFLSVSNDESCVSLINARYYYAIITCDTIDAATHIYTELNGTELERSANVFDLSYVPDDMTFGSECRYSGVTHSKCRILMLWCVRDEATDDSNPAYKGIDFVTDVSCHPQYTYIIATT